jgi:hypothetical protein
MQKMVALIMIVYAATLVLGETLRNHLFPETSRKRKAFSGPFVLIKLKLNLPMKEFEAIALQALQSFILIVSPVRTSETHMSGTAVTK